MATRTDWTDLLRGMASDRMASDRREADAKLAFKLFDYDNIRRDDAAEQERRRARLEKATLLSDKHKLASTVRDLESQIRKLRAENDTLSSDVTRHRAETRELKIENARLCFACDLLNCDLQTLRSQDRSKTDHPATSCASSCVQARV